MAPQPPAAPSAPALKLEGLNRTPIGAAAVPFPTSILTAKFRRGGPALATTGSSQDNSRLFAFPQWVLIFEQSVNHKRGPRSWPQIGAAATWLLCVVGVGLSPILSFWMAGTLGRFLRRKLRQRLETAPRSEGEQAARNPNGWPRPRVHTAYRSRDCDRRSGGSWRIPSGPTAASVSNRPRLCENSEIV